MPLSRKSNSNSLCVCNTIHTALPNQYLEVNYFGDIRSSIPEDESQLGNMRQVRCELDRIKTVTAKLQGEFHETLIYLMDEYVCISAVELYKRSDISDKTIGQYRRKDHPLPDLYHTLALCIGLNLYPDLAFVLLHKAGHHLDTGASLHRFLEYLIIYHHMESLDLWNIRLSAAGFDVQLPQKKTTK